MTVVTRTVVLGCGADDAAVEVVVADVVAVVVVTEEAVDVACTPEPEQVGTASVGHTHCPVGSAPVALMAATRLPQLAN